MLFEWFLSNMLIDHCYKIYVAYCFVCNVQLLVQDVSQLG
jgi:hypothetical protein